MTDRHAGYIVTLASDTREDDSQEIIKAIRLIRGVSNVQPVGSDPAMQIAQTRERIHIEKELWMAFESKFPIGMI